MFPDATDPVDVAVSMATMMAYTTRMSRGQLDMSLQALGRGDIVGRAVIIYD